MDTTKVAKTNGTEPASASKPNRLGAVATWADERLGLATAAKTNEVHDSRAKWPRSRSPGESRGSPRWLST